MLVVHFSNSCNGAGAGLGLRDEELHFRSCERVEEEEGKERERQRGIFYPLVYSQKWVQKPGQGQAQTGARNSIPRVPSVVART